MKLLGGRLVGFLDEIEKAKMLQSKALDYNEICYATLLHTRDVVINERVRFKCSYSGCSEYGNRLMCPPYIPKVREFKEILSCYYMALLVQLEADIANTKDPIKKAYEYAKKLNLIICELEKEAFNLGFCFSSGLIGGSCKLCKVCPVKDNPSAKCINPQKARPSMEGLGIDVMGTCKNLGIDISFSTDKVVWTGLVLIN